MHPTEVAFVSLFIIVLWSAAIGFAVFPFLSRRKMGFWEVSSFWIAGLVGAIAAVGYSIIILNAISTGNEQLLGEYSLPWFLCSVIAIVGFFLVPYWHALNAKWGKNVADSLLTSEKKDRDKEA